MPVVTAAIMARRRRERQAELARKKKQLAVQKANDQVAATVHFAALDTTGAGALGRSQCRELLLLVTGDSEIDDDGLEMFCTAAKAKALAIGGAVAEHASDDRFPEAAVTSTVYKYRFYLAKRKEVHELFSRWDINMDNGLDRNELRQLITQKELDRRDKREVAGMVVDLEPSEGDIDFIMEECDVNMNGVIDRAELLSALATWAMLAQQQIETRKSAMCAIL